MPEGSAQTSLRPVDFAQPVAEPRVVDGAEEEHQAERRQDAAEHQIVRHLEDEAQKPGQHEHVDEDIGAEAEERVPVARNPPALLRFCRRRHGHRSAPFVDLKNPHAMRLISSDELVTQPKMPPWALIILRPISWNSGKYDPTQSSRTRHS